MEKTPPAKLFACLFCLAQLRMAPGAVEVNQIHADETSHVRMLREEAESAYRFNYHSWRSAGHCWPAICHSRHILHCRPQTGLKRRCK